MEQVWATELTAVVEGPIWGAVEGPVVGPRLPPHTLGVSLSGWPPGTKVASPSETQRCTGGGGGYTEPWPYPSAPVSCSLAPEPGHPASRPRETPHLSLELLADGGVLADMTVQADHVALQLRGEHRGKMCLFIQSSFKQPLPTARHCARNLTHIPVTHPHDWGNRPGKVSGSPEATARDRGCL